MGDKATLLALADRVEALTWPCRETDAAVAVAALGWIARPPRYEGDDIAYGYERADGMVFPGNGGGLALVPRFTASLDAAMTLVPDRDASDILHRAWSALSKARALHMRFYNAESEGSYSQRLARHVTAAALRAKAETSHD